jgi:hypothetical protein
VDPIVCRPESGNDFTLDASKDAWECNNTGNFTDGWLDQGTIDRLWNFFGFSIRASDNNKKFIDVPAGSPSPHFLVVTNQEDPNKLILGVDDSTHNTPSGYISADRDFNDVVFLIEFKTSTGLK